MNKYFLHTFTKNTKTLSKSFPVYELILNYSSQGYEKELEKVIPDEFFDDTYDFISDILYDRCYVCQKKKPSKWTIITKNCQDYEVCSNKCLKKYPKFPRYSKFNTKKLSKEVKKIYNNILKKEKLEVN